MEEKLKVLRLKTLGEKQGLIYDWVNSGEIDKSQFKRLINLYS